MSRTLSPEAKEALFAERTSEVFITLVTLNHPSFTQPARFSSDPTQVLPDAGERGTLSQGEEYLFLPFEFDLPAQDDTGIANARIVIDNIDRRIVAAARTANSAVDVTISVVLASNPDVHEITISGFKIDKVNYNAVELSGVISVEYFDLEPFPAKRFTPSDYPGIF